jgi:predicted PurR-regulated permease PerM
MRDEAPSLQRLLLLCAGGVLLFLFVWFEWRLLFLAFAGLLLSIVLHSIAAWVERRTPLRPLAAYLATLLFIAGVVVGAAFALGPRIITQLSDLVAILPQAKASAVVHLQQSSWGVFVLHVLQRAMSGTGAHLTSVAKDLMEGTVDLVLIAVIGFFGALNPRGYREGLLALVPAHRRQRARQLSEDLIRTLRSWILGQMIPMAVLGICSMIALWMLHVPLAFTVGLLTGVLIFVPYLGSVSSGCLAVLLALRCGTHTALDVFLLYCVFHLMEGYLLTPFVQKRAVRLPPVVTILAQFFLWSFGGVLGVAIAAPLAAAAMMTVKRLHLTDAEIARA